MKCPMCGADKEAGTTTFTVELGFGVVVVRNVPAQVCVQCGEAWIDDEIAEKLEQTVQESRKNHPAVAVSFWDDIKDKLIS